MILFTVLWFIFLERVINVGRNLHIPLQSILSISIFTIPMTTNPHTITGYFGTRTITEMRPHAPIGHTAERMQVVKVMGVDQLMNTITPRDFCSTIT